MTEVFNSQSRNYIMRRIYMSLFYWSFNYYYHYYYFFFFWGLVFLTLSSDWGPSNADEESFGSRRTCKWGEGRGEEVLPQRTPRSPVRQRRVPRNFPRAVGRAGGGGPDLHTATAAPQTGLGIFHPQIAGHDFRSRGNVSFQSFWSRPGLCGLVSCPQSCWPQSARFYAFLHQS